MTWVKLELVRGESSGGEWQVDASAAGARLEIGADPSCNWVVSAPGVSPKHVEAYWDGQVLWVARTHGAGEVRVDGLLVDDWYATARGSTIVFGGAQLNVHAGTAILDTSGVPNRREDTGHTEQKTTVASPSGMGDMRPSTPDVPTAPIKAPPAHSPHSPHSPELAGAATQIITHGSGGMGQEAAERIAAFEAQRASAEAGPVFGGAGTPGAQATQLVSMPSVPGGAPPAVGGPRPPPPQIGAHGSVQRASEPPPAVLPKPAPVPPPATPKAPAGAAGGAVADFAGTSDPDAETLFTAPPSRDPNAKKRRWGRKGPKAPKAAKSGGGKATSLPLRTWVLLIVTVAALVAVLFMGDNGEQEVASGDGSNSGAEPGDPDPPPPTGPQPTGDTNPGPATEAPAPDAGQRPSLGAVDPSGEGERGDPPARATEEEGEEGEESADANVRRAVDALLANRQRDAYALYSRLAAQYPDEPAYAAIRDVLRRRLQAQCRGGVDPQGNPCENVE